ncbi:MAG: glycosyltransferase family 2 protein [Candidatus Dojkabacteria bacterium]|nr:glycosyltransferase family 2 protein [Candidatus Dojkabacteria bacterium]
MKKLSIIMPAYNEEKTLRAIVEKVIEVKLPDGFEKEIIIVNDCSKDKTKEIAEELAKTYNNIILTNNPQNMGKSQSVRNGILKSTGDVVIIQDADLEYEPSDFAEMLKMMIENGYDVVYGNRFGRSNKVIYWQNYFGNLFLSFISNIFTFPRIKTYIPDMEVCYKMVRGDVLREIAQNITSKSNFGFEPEVTAKLSKYKITGRPLKFGIYPIYYYARSIADGKKMKAIEDGIKALKEIVHYNIIDK